MAGSIFATSSAQSSDEKRPLHESIAAAFAAATTTSNNNDSNTMSSPSDLYPQVQDLSEVEYMQGDCGACGGTRRGSGSSSGSPSGTFGNFQLQDLVLPSITPSTTIWNTLCPYDDQPMASTSTEIDTNEHNQEHDQQLLETASEGIVPLSPTRTTRTRSTADATEVALVEDSTTLAPAITTTASQPQHVQDLYQATNENEEVQLADYHDNNNHQTDNNNNDDSKQLPPKTNSRKLHLRRKSRQLMSLLLVRSNSMNSSTKEVASTCTADMTVHNDMNAGTEVETEIVTGEQESSGASAAATALHPQVSTRRETRKNFTDAYILTRQIFKCRYSTIWECLHRDSGIRYCVKIFERTEGVPSNPAACAEIDMHYELSQRQEGHPNLVQLVDVITESSAIYLVMTWVAGGNLLSLVVQEGPLDEFMARHLTRDILLGLSYLHSKHVVHGDLQPENILLAAGTNPPPAIIADFGSAVDLTVHDPFGARFGNVLYMAPEMLKGVEIYDTQADSWSVGCLVYFMLTKASPFDDEGGVPSSKRKMKSKILRAEYQFPHPNDSIELSRDAKRFISNMIHADPSVRMTVEEALEHPWLQALASEEEEEERQEEDAAPVHRRRGSKGMLLDATTVHLPILRTSARNLLDNSRASSSCRQERSCSPFPTRPHSTSRSPANKNNKSRKKHHRKISSLKTITKLFFGDDNGNTSNNNNDVTTSSPPRSPAHILKPDHAKADDDYPSPTSAMTYPANGLFLSTSTESTGLSSVDPAVDVGGCRGAVNRSASFGRLLPCDRSHSEDRRSRRNQHNRRTSIA